MRMCPTIDVGRNSGWVTLVFEEAIPRDESGEFAANPATRRLAATSIVGHTPRDSLGYRKTGGLSLLTSTQLGPRILTILAVFRWSSHVLKFGTNRVRCFGRGGFSAVRWSCSHSSGP